jgi:mRNA interferase MazF
VPFPFTNQSGSKQRPAVIVSSGNFNTNKRDLIIMAITSQIRTPLGFGEASINNWHAAGLIKPSLLKPVVTTIEQRLVIRRLGSLSVDDASAARAALQLILR